MAIYKIVNVEQLDADLKVVADAIREKGGTTDSLEFPNGMKAAIEALEASSSPSDMGGYDESTGKLWGYWDISNFDTSGISYDDKVYFNFYGYVDGVYIDGAPAYFWHEGYGVTLCVDGKTVHQANAMDTGVLFTLLTNNTIGFGTEPQPLCDGNDNASMTLANWFVGFATPTTEPSFPEEPDEPEEPESGEDDTDGGYDTSSGYLWGYWDISNMKDDYSSSSSARFDFYGYVDGVYIDGRTAFIRNSGGDASISIDGEIGIIYQSQYGTVNVNRLTNNTIGFGPTPQPLMTYQGEYYPDYSATMWFVGFATPTTKPIVSGATTFALRRNVTTPNAKGNYDRDFGDLYGCWDITNIKEGTLPQDSGSNGIYCAHFTFYGFADGTYHDGVPAYFRDCSEGISLYVDGVEMYRKTDGVVCINKLVSNMIGFGIDPQPLNRDGDYEPSHNLTTWFVGFAIPKIGPTATQAYYGWGYNDFGHLLWGTWKIDESGSSAWGNANFIFYGYIDGVYQAGVPADFYNDDQDNTFGIRVNDITVWECSDNQVITNKLTNGIVGFGSMPQAFDSITYDGFKNRATKIF